MLLGLGLVPALCGQVVLNFNDLVLANYAPIPTNYGSGLYPNLSGITYRTFTFSSNATLNAYVESWNTDYGDLTNLAFPAANGFAAEVNLVPAAGYGINLISFDMAGWPTTDRANTIFCLLDGNGTVLLDYAAAGAAPIQGAPNGPLHSSFTPNVSFAAPSPSTGLTARISASTT